LLLDFFFVSFSSSLPDSSSLELSSESLSSPSRLFRA
jgi:hypothetical protein